VSIRVAGLSKRFPGRRADAVMALDDVSLEAAPGELLVVVGPSGSGKSTLLRCIAGLEEVDSGSVHVGDHDVTHLDPARRDLAMVFQDYALYPHLDVASNIAFPLRAAKVPKDESERRVRAAAEMLDLIPTLGRRPQQLSGGEKRRVSLARAVVRQPKAFLMDEPLSNLDANLKLRVQDEIRRLQERLGVTTLYVTHDQMEALALGDRMAVLRAGKVEQVGVPLDVHDHPRNTFVARLVGRLPMNITPGAIWGLEAPEAGIRPESLRLAAEGSGRADGVVRAVDPLGATSLLELDVAGHRVAVEVDRSAAPAPGTVVGLDLDLSQAHRFDADGEAMG
jgi:ABC-type sugar transport system ATPase subunit